MGSVRLGATFERLWVATALVNLGDGVGLFLLPLVAVSVTREPSAVALLTAALTLAWPLFGLHAGLVVDRIDRGSLLAIVNAARAAALVVLTVALVGGAVPLWSLYILALILGAGETLADTALTSLVPATVARGQLGAANARIETTLNLAHQFLGPPLAGALAGVALSLASGTAAAAYVLGVAVLFGFLRPRSSEPRASSGRSGGQVLSGLVFLWSEPLLRRLTLTTATMNLTWAAWTALIVVYAIAPGPMGLHPSAYGLLLATLAVGGVLGGFLVEPLRRRLGIRRLLALDVIGSALLVGAPAVTSEPLVVGLATLIAGTGASLWRIITATLRQSLTPDHLLGRVYSASRLISWGVLPVGAALAGLLADTVGIQAVFALGAVLNLVLFASMPVALPRALLQPRWGEWVHGAEGATPGRSV